MAAITERFLICDGQCGINYGVDMRHESFKEHRRAAKTEGWTFVNGKDYCQQCTINRFGNKLMTMPAMKKICKDMGITPLTNH